MIGEIIKWITDRGFGFIRGENGQEIFCHITAVKIEEGYNRELAVGTGVEYEVEETEKGPRAINVKILVSESQEEE